MPRWARASSGRHEVALRDRVGADRIMWGSDFPHLEGCWPYSRDHLRLAFAGVPEPDVRAMVGGNAARVYGFDLDALAPLAAAFGPSPAEIAEPLAARSDIPDDALRCPTFAAARILRGDGSVRRSGRGRHRRRGRRRPRARRALRPCGA